MDGFNGTTTTITFAGVSVMRGVKQDDSISPILFNMVLDELITQLDQMKGCKFVNIVYGIQR